MTKTAIEGTSKIKTKILLLHSETETKLLCDTKIKKKKKNEDCKNVTRLRPTSTKSTNSSDQGQD